MAKGEYFRAGVAVVVLGPEGSILGCERADAPGSWQVPQGGIRRDEHPRDAAARELEEETGLGPDDVVVVAEYPTWLTYELPPAGRSKKTGLGQSLRFFLVRLVSSEQRIDLGSADDEPEFADWRWMSSAELMAATWEIKRPLYEQVLDDWADHLRSVDRA